MMQWPESVKFELCAELPVNWFTNYLKFVAPRGVFISMAAKGTTLAVFQDWQANKQETRTANNEIDTCKPLATVIAEKLLKKIMPQHGVSS